MENEALTWKEVLWRLYDMQVPLFDIDMETFLKREGIVDDEGMRKWGDFKKAVKECYEKGFSKGDFKTSASKALEIIKSINFLKPLPPEMEIRKKDIISSLERLISNS